MIVESKGKKSYEPGGPEIPDISQMAGVPYANIFSNRLLIIKLEWTTESIGVNKDT